MLGKLAVGGFSLISVASALNQVQQPGLASPQSLLIQNGFIIVLGGWGLLELIRQGKRMATRDDVDKLRDDLTAALLAHETGMESRHERQEARIERDLKERERVVDLQFESLQGLVEQLQTQVHALQEPAA